MKLLKEDLQNYSRLMAQKTGGKYQIKPSKCEGTSYRRLELVNTETGETEFLNGLMTLRESYEYLRAFYKGVNIAKKIAPEEISGEEKFIIESNADYISGILGYYENEFKEYLDDDKREEMNSDFSECYDKLCEIKTIIRKEKEQY